MKEAELEKLLDYAFRKTSIFFLGKQTREHSSFALHRMQPTNGPWMVYLTLSSLYMDLCFLSFVPSLCIIWGRGGEVGTWDH
jgi:hypothetical protein